MRAASLLVVPLLIAALGVGAQNSDLVKNATAGGRYHEEEGGYGGEGGYGTSPKASIVDQYVCDLEATILVVASKDVAAEGHKYGGGGHENGGGYNKAGGYNDNNNYEERPKAATSAVRLKCSHIATRSDEDCQQCCQLAARLDHSVSRRDVSGFIINADELDLKSYNSKRPKRQAPYGGAPQGAASTYSAPASAAPYQPQSPPHGYQKHQPSADYAHQPSAGYQRQPQHQPAPPAAYQQSQAVHDYQKPSSAQTSNTYGYPAPSNSYAAPPATEAAPEQRNEYATSAPGAYASSNSYEFFGVPKNRRCVCCAPKSYDNTATPAAPADYRRQPESGRRYRQRTSYSSN